MAAGRNIALAARVERSSGDRVPAREYIQLRNHLANVEARLAVELQKNRELTAFKKKHPLEIATFVTANIVQSSPDEIMINCGTAEKVAKGQFVLGDNSIIGIVTEVSAHMAKVRLITHPASHIPVIIRNENAILKGSGKGSAKIPLFLREHEVEVNDPVLCRPKHGLLTSPVILGWISIREVDGQQPMLWDITVEPACRIDQIDCVDVIVINPRK